MKSNLLSVRTLSYFVFITLLFAAMDYFAIGYERSEEDGILEQSQVIFLICTGLVLIACQLCWPKALIRRVLSTPQVPVC